MDFGYILTSTTGRIPRSQWWAGVVVLAVIGIVIGVILGYALGGLMTTAGRIAMLILQLVFLYPSYAISAKRFQDRNKSGSFALIGIGLAIIQTLAGLIGIAGNPFAPNALDWILNIALLIVGIWYLVELGILRGTVGPNNFGPDPLEGRV